MVDADRQELLSFLSSKQEGRYEPASGEVTGILKQMQDTMVKSLATATADEASAVTTHNELIAAKTKEVETLTSSIETKTVRDDELAVSTVHAKDDLKDTEEGL